MSDADNREPGSLNQDFISRYPSFQTPDSVPATPRDSADRASSGSDGDPSMISTSDKPSFSSDVDLIGPPARDNRDTPLLDAAPFESLDENHIALEIISGSIFTGFLAAAAIAGLIALFFFGGVNWIWFGAAGVSIVLVLGSGILAVIWPPIEYRHISWRLDEASLEIHRGVFWKHQISIPLGRVQHADVSQGPLQRYFRMGSLTVHTAGTNLPSIQLDGLPHQTALLLRDRLVLQSQLEDVT